MKTQKIAQLKITLKNVEPAVWRRILVPTEMSLKKLHDAIQLAMGWDDSHLHSFRINDEEYGDIAMDEGDMLDERKIKVGAVALVAKKFIYLYDFGDGWEHSVVVEKILEPEANQKYPVCIGGKNACPPEDCGGPWSYGELLEIVKNPKHPEYKDRAEWLGKEFNPQHFDVEKANEVGLWQRRW